MRGGLGGFFCDDEEVNTESQTFAALAERCQATGLAAGLDAVGVCAATPFSDVKVLLEERRTAGLAANMQFTYRNPARSTTPQRILENAQTLVVAALRTPAPRLNPAEPGQTRIAAYARTDHYTELKAGLEAIAEELRQAGWQARVVADDNALVDRAAAVRAGLGWYGKNANVLLPGRGSWFVLGSVVTDAPLPVNQELVPDGCGTCDQCITGCPTGAIVKPGVVDARRCIAWLVQAPGPIPIEFREAMGDRIYGCDECQEVCPVGRPERTSEGKSDPTADLDALAILNATDQELLDSYGRWYIAERDPKYLRRNALVVLGNSPGENAQIDQCLEYYRDHYDPLLCEHAQWAINKRATL